MSEGEWGPVLVVGNSYTGAIIAAMRRDPALTGDRLDVAAAGGNNYRAISVKEGRVTNARFFQDRTRPVGDYAVIFLYGYLPHPIELVMIAHRLRKQRHSSQVTALAIRDAITEAASLHLMHRFRAETAKPILLMPGNPPANAPATPADERAAMAELLRELVGEGYLPPPDGLLDQDGRPIAAFYKDSVTITGASTADPNQAKHDMLHFNADGGALWLAAILAKAKGLQHSVHG